MQGRTNTGCKLAHATKLCTVASECICEPSVPNLLLVIVVACRRLRWLLYFKENCTSQVVTV
jgi:hypothetical protein